MTLHNPSELCKAALAYAEQGWPVFPLHNPTKNGTCTCGKPDCRHVGKHPRTTNGLTDATTDSKQIKRWWDNWPNANIGVVTGQASGFWVLDVDGPEGEASLATLEEEHGALPETRSVSTGRGRHLHFRWPPGTNIRGSASKIAPRLDVRAEGNYIIAPPSLHEFGMKYEWRSSPDTPLADASEWLVERVQASNRPSKTDKQPDLTDVLQGVPEGKRDDALFKYACKLFARGLNRSEVEALILTSARNCTPPFPDNEALKCVSSAAKYHDENALPVGKFFLPMRWVRRIEADHHVVSVNGELLLWTLADGYYKPWRNDELTRLCIRLGGDEVRMRQVEEIRKLLVDDTARPAHEADRGNLLCIGNGILDYETGEMVPHTPDIILTSRLPVSFDPIAVCPQYDAFLTLALPDPAQQLLIHEIFAYCLIRDTRYQKAFLWLDNDIGTTGKSTAGEILQRFLGPGKYRDLPLNQLSERFKTAELYRVHANISSETDVKDFLKDGMIKTLISGETITVERKYENPFTFRPYAKQIVTANRFPNTYDTGDPFFRRWIILMFNHQFPKPGEPGNIPRFAETLSQGELDGIFLHALRGLARLKENNGFTVPESSAAAIEKFRRMANPVLDFATQCLGHDPKARGTTLKRIYDAYKSWCTDEGCPPKNYRNFRRAIQDAIKVQALDSSIEHQLILPGYYLKAEHERHAA